MFLQLIASGFQCLKMEIVVKLFSFFEQVEGAQTCYFKFLLIEGDEREDTEVTRDVASDVPLM